MSNTDRGNLEVGAEMEGEASPARVVSARGVDHQEVEGLVKLFNGCGQKASLPQGQQSWSIGATSRTCHYGRVQPTTVFEYHRSGPPGVARRSRPAPTSAETDENSGDTERTLRHLNEARSLRGEAMLGRLELLDGAREIHNPRLYRSVVVASASPVEGR